MNECDDELSTHFHDKEDNEDNDTSNEWEQTEEKAFTGPLAIDTPVTFRTMWV